MDQLVDIRTLSTLDDVIKAYDRLCAEETDVNKQINDLLSDDKQLESSMARLRKDMPNMSLIESDAKQLSSLIQFTSSLADSVSYKVRRLDLAKTRVTQCLQRIEDILDLKFCTDGIQKALSTENYEQAAAHIHRFLSMDESILRKSAETQELSASSLTNNEMNASSMDEAFQRLHEAEVKLKNIVMKRFDEAVSDDDVASVERFFKIFPLLNQHSEGLKKFSNYLCTKVNEKCLNKNNSNQSSATHSDKLTQLYECIAKTIDIHQPLVETYYGPGKLVTVVDILQKECDRVSKRIIDDFKVKKNLPQVITLVTKSLKASSSYQTSTKVDPRDLDQLLSDIIILNNRSEMYLRFITKRSKSDIEVAFPETSVKPDDQNERRERLQQMDSILRNCDLSHSIHELNGIYVLIEEYFIRESTLKAIQLDCVETSGALTSSMLDDVFFIIKKCIKRALSGGSVDVVCAVINHSVSILETSFCDSMNERLRYGYPSTISGAAAALDLSQAYNALQAGRYLQTSSDVENAKTLFLSSLNNLDTACEYVKTLKTTISEDVKKSTIAEKHQNEKLESCLSDMVALSGRFNSIITSGLGQLCSSVLKPRIKIWIDAFISYNHILSEEELIGFETTDGLRPFMQTFIISLNTFVKSFKDSLTQNNSDTLLSLFSTELIQRLSDAVLKCSYNKLGGFQFDRELRAIINYLTGATTWSIRDKFSKLKHISIILNLENVEEINEYLNPSSSDSGLSTPWRLTPNEVKQALRLRHDFNSLDIKKLNL
ncbi:conserved oligomeric Golgi complex subunit 4-like [Oppia nitens]|uniref:conserved oligomeric Golgi complex subunit 4-like n=1 Tax=Oppia nitens TaxID=1686743 RepID=UPI0023D99BFB|nr:conserved oligomeric Golgi complex subunit 4-like [Oppia nitens]